MVESDVPACVDNATAFPHHSCRPWSQHVRPEVALLQRVVSARGIPVCSWQVFATIEDRHRATTCHATRICNWRLAWAPPRHELPYVLWRPWCRVAISGSIFWQVQGRPKRRCPFMRAVIPVGEPRAVGVARLAPGCAALREPEHSLPWFARRRAVLALDAQWLDRARVRVATAPVHAW